MNQLKTDFLFNNKKFTYEFSTIIFPFMEKKISAKKAECHFDNVI